MGYGVRPQLYGRTVRIHPAVVLIALPAGFEVAGVIGLFAAVPVIAVVLTVWSSAVLLLEPEVPPVLPALVPPALDRAAQISWRLLVALGVIALVAAGVVLVPLVVMPVTVGLVGAATLVPVVHWLEGRGHGHVRASAIAVGGTVLIVIVVLGLTVASLVDQAQQIATTTSTGAASASDSLGGQLQLGTDAIGQGLGALVRTLIGVGETLASMVVVALLGTLLAFYLLRDGAALWARSIARVPSSRRPEVDLAGTRAVSVLGGYMIGTAAISFVGAASQWLIMVILGLPLALPVFVLSFLLCFIPYIGGFISTGIAFLIAVAVGTPEAILVMLIWTVVFNLVQGNVVSPLVYGKTVHLHPAIVLVAIPAAASVAGIDGHVPRGAGAGRRLGDVEDRDGHPRRPRRGRWSGPRHSRSMRARASGLLRRLLRVDRRGASRRRLRAVAGLPLAAAAAGARVVAAALGVLGGVGAPSIAGRRVPAAEQLRHRLHRPVHVTEEAPCSWRTGSDDRARRRATVAKRSLGQPPWHAKRTSQRRQAAVSVSRFASPNARCWGDSTMSSIGSSRMLPSLKRGSTKWSQE